MAETEERPKRRGRPKRVPNPVSMPANRPVEVSELPPEDSVHNYAQLAMDARGLGVLGQSLIKLPGIFQAAADMQGAVLRLQLFCDELSRRELQLKSNITELEQKQQQLETGVFEKQNLLTQEHTAEIDRQLLEYRASAEQEMQALKESIEESRQTHQAEMEQMAERRTALMSEIEQIEQLVRQHQTGLGSLMQSVQAISVEG